LFAPLVCVPPDWSKFSVVCLPTFIVCQVSTALCAVCCTLTVTVPLGLAVCCGPYALIHSRGLLVSVFWLTWTVCPPMFCAANVMPCATCRPPTASPFGTVDAVLNPAAAAACCAAICCAIPCAACARFWIDG
jgi:hypothetical protein